MKKRGDEIKEIRKMHSISQFELAEYIGISQNMLSKFENGMVDSLSIYDIAIDLFLNNGRFYEHK